MQGFSKILVEEHGSRLDDEGRNYLQRIGVSARRLDALIDDVLSYSKIVRSELPLESVQPDEFVHQIIDSYPDLHSHRAEIHLQEPMPPVLANPAAFTQVVSNLLGNAVKFARPGVKPDVRVRAELINKPQHPAAKNSAANSSPSAVDGPDAQGNFENQAAPSKSPSKAPPQNANRRMVRLWFEDNGIGIQKQLFDRIFLMFQRLHPAQEYEGTGIGLTIVRKAVERMGGAVGLESDPGKGSRFWIELREAA
jgi:signal transduction histidine kinase